MLNRGKKIRTETRGTCKAEPSHNKESAVAWKQLSQDPPCQRTIPGCESRGIAAWSVSDCPTVIGLLASKTRSLDAWWWIGKACYNHCSVKAYASNNKSFVPS